LPSCVSPDAVKISAEIQGIKNDMTNIEKLADDMSVWRKNIQAENIDYGGIWIVVGVSVVVLIFVGAGLFLIRAFMKRGNMLTMLTRAVKNSGSGTIANVKYNLKECVHKGYHCKQDMVNLGAFAKKRGTFVERK